jgi:ubiquinone/menaquinone biosynthesis C-methylase UbiE
MLARILEPEAMDTPEEARDYDRMGHDEVNARFVADFLQVHGPCRGGVVLDVGTGPSRIPILLCQADPAARVLGIDLAESMLELARRNVAGTGLSERISLAKCDAKSPGLTYGRFEAILSNAIVHHIPEPGLALAQMVGLVEPGGTLMVRDLERPDNMGALTALLEKYAAHESASARAMFAASLHAALTMDEVRALVATLGLPVSGVTRTSDRHWTWIWRPGADV